LQFLGFLPRLLLGLVFGYVYLWSGKLWLPILAHFINNVVPVITAFIFGWDQVGNGGDIKIWQELIVLPIPLFLLLQIMIYFRNKTKEKILISVQVNDEIDATDERAQK